MTLNNFSMHKNFTDINETNNKFTVRVNNNAGSADGTLTKRNNTTLNALADDFATAIFTALKAASGFGGTLTSTTLVTPSSTTSVGGDSDHVISFLLTFSGVHGINGANSNICQFYLEQGDSYEILGGDRVEDLADTTIT
jgi:hypothetical protein